MVIPFPKSFLEPEDEPVSVVVHRAGQRTILEISCVDHEFIPTKYQVSLSEKQVQHLKTRFTHVLEQIEYERDQTMTLTEKLKSMQLADQEKLAHRVVNAAAIYAKVPREKVLGQRWNRRFIVPRFAAIRVIRDNTNLSLPEIGVIFGNRDHTTIINALKRVENNPTPDMSSCVEYLEQWLETEMVKSKNTPNGVDV